MKGQTIRRPVTSNLGNNKVKTRIGYKKRNYNMREQILKGLSRKRELISKLNIKLKLPCGALQRYLDGGEISNDSLLKIKGLNSFYLPDEFGKANQ